MTVPDEGTYTTGNLAVTVDSVSVIVASAAVRAVASAPSSPAIATESDVIPPVVV